jgi:hypothetical protein
LEPPLDPPEDEPEPDEPEPDDPDMPEPPLDPPDEPCGFADAPEPPERVPPVVSGFEPERWPLDVVAEPKVSLRVLLRTETPERSRTLVPTPTETPVRLCSRTVVRRLRTDTLDDGSSVLCTTTRRPPRTT